MNINDIYEGQTIGFKADGEIVISTVSSKSDEHPSTHIIIEIDGQFYEKRFSNILGLVKQP